MKKRFFLVVAAVITAAGALFSCHGGSSGDNATSGTVGLYVTDDMSLFSQVTGTIDAVQLVSSGAGTSCDLLSAPVTANIANLANVIQLVGVTQCPAVSYNRLRLVFDQGVQLMSGTTGTLSNCSFTSYIDQASGNQPNVLNCDPGTNVCTLDVNGAVNVLASNDNKLALDFDLKNFEVMNFGMPSCSVTMKVSPLTADEMRQHGSQMITGSASGLDTATGTFDLTRGDRTFKVLYGGITTSSQPDLTMLLQRAEDDGLRTMVTTSNIDLGGNTITATAIAVKVEGTVSNLAAAFSVSYGQGGAKSISVDYSGAAVSGIVGNGSWVDVRLIGHDLTGNFIAGKVEVESAGMMTEN